MEQVFLKYLIQEIENTGHSVRCDNNTLFVELIDVGISCQIGEIKHHQQGVVISVSIKATHQILFPSGIWDCLAGVGENEEAAWQNAASVWISGVFPVIHELFVPFEKATNQVNRLDIVSSNPETKEEFAWILYLGPLQASGVFRNSLEELDESILVQKMLNALSVELYYKRMVWVKAFICQMPDGSINGDCWLNNQDWIEGLNALFWYASEWEENGTFAALKQFMVIMPRDWSEVENVDDWGKYGKIR